VPAEGYDRSIDYVVRDRGSAGRASKEKPMDVKPIPDGYHTITPYLIIKDAAGAIDFYKKAIDAGATELMPVNDTFWGDRFGKLKDPFGHEWSIATHKQDLTLDEIRKGAEEFFATCSPPSG
jgi:hypothetical protein